MKAIALPILILSLTVGGLAASSPPSEAQDKAAPKIKLSTDRLNFGSLQAGRSVESTIEIENAGDAPLKIGRVGVNCGCASLQLSTARRLNVPIDSRDQGRTDLTLAPGKKAKLKLSIETSNLQPGELNKRCLIFSDDPQNSPVSVPFTLKVLDPPASAATPTSPMGISERPRPSTLTPPDLPKGPPPRTEADEYVHNFGEIFRGEELDHDFEIRNTGEGPLYIIKASGSCKCTASSLTIGDIEFGAEELKLGCGDRAKIEPGEKATLNVKLETAGIAGSRKQRTYPLRKYIRVYTNDSTRNPVQLSIEADLVDPLKMAPEKIKIGPVHKKDGGSATIELWSETLGEFGIQQADAADSDKIQVTFEKGEPREDGSPSYRLSVKAKPDIRAGFHRDNIRLVMQHEKVKELLVPVELEILADVTFKGNSKVRPDQLDFGFVDPAKGGSIDMLIENANPEIPYLPGRVAINARPNKELFSHEIIEVEKGVQYKLRLTVSEGITGRFFQGTVIVYSDHPDVRAKAVRFKGLVKKPEDTVGGDGAKK